MSCNNRWRELSQYIASIPQEEYQHHSRIHKLHSLSTDSTPCYIKRDDELSFGISGTKVRKLRTLIASLKKRNIAHACVIDTFHSSNVLALCQLLIENRIIPKLFLLKGSIPENPVGNYLLTRLFVAEKSITWVERSAWKSVNQLAEEESKR